MTSRRGPLGPGLLRGCAFVAAFAAAGVHGASPGGPGYLTADAVYDPQALRALAEQGDKRAAFLLGSRFASGRSGVRDDSEAVRWFRQAAEGGLAEAQYNLGIMYAGGRGLPRDYAQAARWYEKAAEQGLAEAQFNLGTLYGLGRGVARDEAAAARWLEKAARRGLPQAQYNLAALYEHGRGVRLDGHRALEWYRRAAEHGFEPAKERHAALSKKLAAPAAGTAARTPEPPPATVRVEQAPAPERPPSPRPQAGSGERADDGSAWIASLDPAGYTIQLASYTSPEDASRFVGRFRPEEAVAVYASTKGGKEWYSVVYGSYPSFAAAKEAVAAMPARLRRMKPWVRKVAQIHKQMR